MLMTFIKKYHLTIVGIALGAIGGYLYYHYIGCLNGICAITSKPVNSTLYGSLMGGLALNLFERKEKEPNN
jgi:hypothetical protein